MVNKSKMDMRDWLNQTFWDNTYLSYLIAIASILLVWLILQPLKKYFIRYLQKLVKNTYTLYDDMAVEVVGKNVLPFLLLLLSYLIITQLNIHPRLEKILQVAKSLATLWYAVRFTNTVMHGFIRGYMESRLESPDRIKQMKGVLIVLKAIVWFMGIVVFLDNLGYDVATILAGMGIGGIAIALASQAVLGDIFSYFVIFFDKPFEIGDFINVEGKTGTIEYIGIKTTRIRSLGGEQIIMSNKKLTDTPLHNFKRMEKRRVLFSVSVIYQTSSEQLKKIPMLIEDAVKSQELTEFDRAHLVSFGDFSINFEVVYFILSPEYMVFMDAQQQILQSIFEKFEKERIEFAYPTQKIFIESDIPATV